MRITPPVGLDWLPSDPGRARKEVHGGPQRKVSLGQFPAPRADARGTGQTHLGAPGQDPSLTQGLGRAECPH